MTKPIELKDIPAPARILNIANEAGEARVLTMTYGIINWLCSTLPSPEAVSMYVGSPDIQRTMLYCTLVPRDEQGRPTLDGNGLDVDVLTHDLGYDTVLDILEWVAAHVTYFFLSSLYRQLSEVERTKTFEAYESLKVRMEALKKAFTPNGGQPSA
jgi:hypothetical protein